MQKAAWEGAGGRGGGGAGLRLHKDEASLKFTARLRLPTALAAPHALEHVRAGLSEWCWAKPG